MTGIEKKKVPYARENVKISNCSAADSLPRSILIRTTVVPESGLSQTLLLSVRMTTALAVVYKTHRHVRVNIHLWDAMFERSLKK